METTKRVRVMHPDVFDTLEFGALVFGGIGASKDFERDYVPIQESADCPYCVWGLGYAATIPVDVELISDQNPVSQELLRVGITRSQNDGAVARVNARRQKDVDFDKATWGLWSRNYATRVPFRPWAKELGIVRGNAEDFPESESEVATEGVLVNSGGTGILQGGTGSPSNDSTN